MRRLPPRLRKDVEPRLDPDLRSNMFTEQLEVRPRRDALRLIEQEAARRYTTAAILASVLLEIVAAKNLCGAILDLRLSPARKDDHG
jgi:hypothetical protein